MPATKKQNRPAVGAGHARDQEAKPPGCRSGPCPRPEAKTARLQERAMPATRSQNRPSVGAGHARDNCVWTGTVRSGDMAPSYGPGNRVSPTASTPVCSTSARKPARCSICRTVREPGQPGCA